MILWLTGQPGSVETADTRYFWGIKTEGLAPTGSITDSVLKSNIGNIKNKTIKFY